MAKQSFSVGQVLTAAQMTSLQQTAMLGGSATAKTTSYTLVAADAGTVVSVNSTSATTITVNTGLFSAGDTVTIQNWGSGAVTITAGTATVNTAGSLIVPQYDGGVLYFTSASAAIYFDWVQAGATSPLTTKGDIWGYGTSDARIPIGANGTILTADSAETLGLKWATPGGTGANWSLLNSGGTTLSGTNVSITGISGADKIMVLIANASITTAGIAFGIRINSDSGSNYYQYGQSDLGEIQQASTKLFVAYLPSSTTASGGITLTGCNSSGVKAFQSISGASGAGEAYSLQGYYNSSSTISSVQVYADGFTFGGGTVYVYTSA